MFVSFKRYVFILFVLCAGINHTRGQYSAKMPIDYGISILSRKCEDARSSGIRLNTSDVITLSGLYNKRSRYKEADALVTEALKEAVNRNEKKEIILLTIEKADVFKYLGKNDEALKLYFEAERKLKGISDPEIAFRQEISLAEFYRKIVKHKDAMIQLENARTILYTSGIKDTSALIRFYNRYAAVENELEGDSIILFSLRAIRLSRLIHDPYSEATSMNELGLYFKNRRAIDTSMACYKQAEDAWRKVGALNDAAQAMFNRAQLISHNYLPHKNAAKILDEIIKLHEQGLIDYPIHNVYVAQCDNYFFMGDSANHTKYKIKALEATIEYNRRSYEADITKVKEKYENEKMQTEMSEVSGRLTAAEEILKLKETETRRIYIFLSVVIVLLVLIAFLFYRIYFSNKRLEQRYKEKEALIQEIHHRVKNNLQFVSSLINMQINASPDLEMNHAFHDAARRIKAMSLVHEMLYNNDNTGGILINKYLAELVHSMNDLVNTREIPVDFNVSCKEVDFTTTNAIALGMITSELIANSIKHAFAGVDRPCIKIELEMSSSRSCSFHYSDNGKEQFEIKKETKRLGMRLIDIFSRQLKGNYRFERSEGLHYYLQFNV